MIPTGRMESTRLSLTLYLWNGRPCLVLLQDPGHLSGQRAEWAEIESPTLLTTERHGWLWEWAGHLFPCFMALTSHPCQHYMESGGFFLLFAFISIIKKKNLRSNRGPDRRGKNSHIHPCEERNVHSCLFSWDSTLWGLVTTGPPHSSWERQRWWLELQRKVKNEAHLWGMGATLELGD